MQFEKSDEKQNAGTATVEQLVLLVVVAIGVVAATLVLGPALLKVHGGIELVLALPIP